MGTPRYGAYLDSEIIDTDAFRSLSPSAFKILVGFRRRVRKAGKKDPGSKTETKHGRKVPRFMNGQEIVYTFKDMQAEVGTKRPATVTSGRDELIEKGFIKIRSGFQGRAVVTNEYGWCWDFLIWHKDADQRATNGFVDRKRKPHKFHNKFHRQSHEGATTDLSPATQNRSGATTVNRRRPLLKTGVGNPV